VLLLLLPGAAPFFMSERAMDKLRSRKTKPQTYNLDMNLIGERSSNCAAFLPRLLRLLMQPQVQHRHCWSARQLAQLQFIQ
jgi:hypothetical protein